MSSQNDQHYTQEGVADRGNDGGMDFEGHLRNTWLLTQDEPVFVIGGGILVPFLIALSLGILAGPLGGSYTQALIDALRGKSKPRLNDLVSGLGRFGSLFPYFFLMVLIIVGFFFLLIPGFLFITWWLYALPLMADRRLSLGAAMEQSKALVARKGFFLHLVFVLLVTVVPSMIVNVLSGVIPILSVLNCLLFPLQSVCLASLYLEQFEGRPPGGSSPQHTPSPQPPSPPPPPVIELPLSTPGPTDAGEAAPRETKTT